MSVPQEPSPEASAEREDVEKVNQAIAALMKGDLRSAERLLQAVIARTPPHYVNAYEHDGTLFAKYWDQEEFIHAVMRQKARGEERSVTWLGNAYPRAHYYMGFLEVERGRTQEALRWLDAGQKLEPRQPQFRLEKGKVLSSLGDLQSALALYSEVLAMGEDVTPTARAAALRGRGFQLIEMNHLDEAETCFLDSLELDPNSKVAHNELGYIAQLRKGGPAAPTQTTKTGGQSGMACAVCGKTNQEGKVGMVDGKMIFLCKACETKLARKPRQFWKH